MEMRVSKSGRTVMLGVLSMVMSQRVRAQGLHVNGAGFDPTPVEIPVIAKATPRPITSTDLLTIRDLHGLALSPDGKSVAFVVGQAVYATNSYRSGLFVVGTAPGSVPRSLGTAGPPRWTQLNEWQSEAPQWSPDSRYITYRLNTGGTWQVWRWSREGGEPVQLTHNSWDVQRFEWSSDGRQIRFVVRRPLDPHRAADLAERGILYDGRAYSWEGRPVVDQELEREPDELEDWVYDVATGTERRAPVVDWQRKLGPEFATEKEQLNGRLGHILYPKLSPDGERAIYMLWVDDAEKGATMSFPLYVKPLREGAAIALTPGGNVAEYWWSKDSHEVYFTKSMGDGHAHKLFVVSANGGAARQLGRTETTDWMDEYSLDDAAAHAACLRATNTTPAQVALLDLRTGVLRTLVDVNPEFQNLLLSPATRLEWTNKYGITTHGYLVKPLQYETGKRYPLVVTTYRSGDYFLRGGEPGDEYPIQVFAANGFAVLAFDYGPSPSIKPGDFKGAMLTWEWPMASLEAGLKLLDDMGIVDAKRRGLTGLSFGSEITDFTISHSDLFQAASLSGGGSRDPFFYYMAGKLWHKIFADWGLGGWPEGKASANWHELAPSLNADHVSAPLLSNAAETEYVVGLSDYTALEQLGKPVELFIYPNELHVKNQPKHRYEIYERNVDWFKFWLQGIEDPDLTKKDQYDRWHKLRELHTKDLSQRTARSDTGAVSSGRD